MSSELRSAVADFQQSRRRAQIEAVLNGLSGRSNELLSYEDVRKRLRLGTSVIRGVDNVPIESIIGSVGRYHDFTRSFLPRHDSDQDRWARVKAGVADLSGLPPVELYKIGEAYFVIDGHHRISVARQVGATYIEAYVREVPSRVKLTPDIDPQELILKYEYSDFLYETRFDEVIPDVELRLTEAGMYPVLKEHIDVHRFYMGVELEREIPYEEAIQHWYEKFYRPVVEVIHRLGVLRDFPDRTETDLYLWSVNYRAELEEELGWSITTAAAVSELASAKSSTPGRILRRVGRWLHDILLPDAIEPGPKPGLWRRELVLDEDSELFPSILVPLSERDSDWQALEQAMVIAGWEKSVVHGLYVRQPGSEQTAVEHRLQEEFLQRVEGAGISGQFVVQEGQVARTICDRSRWDNLVVLFASYPPADRPMDRLSSGLRMMLHRCPRPILIVQERARPVEHVLLAYNDSIKAREALFVAAHIARSWGSRLTVVAAPEKGMLGYDWLGNAREYLEKHEVKADYHHKFGSVPSVIDHAASQYGCDMILMGGYKAGPITEVVLGSKVDELMRRTDLPMLVCS